MKRNLLKIILLAVLAFSLAALAAGCVQNMPQPTPTVSSTPKPTASSAPTPTVSPTPAGEPSVTPAFVTVDRQAETPDAVTLTLSLNNGEFIWIKLGGEDLTPTAFTIEGCIVTLAEEYLLSLSTGEHIFTVESTGGTCNFTIIVINNGFTVTGARVAEYAGTDAVFSISANGNAVTSVTISGFEIPDGAYEWGSASLTIKRAYVSDFADGLYPIVVANEHGKTETLYLAKGMTADQIFSVDYDAFPAPDNGYCYQIGEGDHTVEPQGLNGASGRIINRSKWGAGNGFLAVIGHNSFVPYPFEAGANYTLRFDVKMVQPPPDNGCVMVIKTAADLAELYADRLELKGGATGSKRELANGAMRVEINFTYDSGTLELPFFNPCTVLVDNFLLTPATGSLAGATFEQTYQSGSDTDVSVRIGGVTVFDVSDGAKSLIRGTDYSVAGDILTLRCTYLEATGNVTLRVVTNCGEAVLTVTVVDRVPSMDTAEFTFLYDSEADLAVPFDSDGLALSKVRRGGSELSPDTDYTVTETGISLKNAYLKKQTEKQQFSLTFENGASLAFQVTSNLIMLVDWDTASPDDYSNFLYSFLLNGNGNMTPGVTDSGIDGNSGTLENTGAGSIGNNIFFVDRFFTEGQKYTVSYDFKIESVTQAGYLILNLGAPIGDISYLTFDTAHGGAYYFEDKSGGAANTVITCRGDVYTVSLSFTARADQECKIVAWTPFTAQFDNFAIRTAV